MKRKLNLETDHQYIAESLPVGRGKARNPAKGTSSTPSGPPCQPSSEQRSSSPRLLPQAHPWYVLAVPLCGFGQAVPEAGLLLSTLHSLLCPVLVA